MSETKKKSQTDPMLRLTARLDRLLSDARPHERGWALAWLLLKYGQADEVTLTAKDLTACK